jgi:Uma2 family endonuclease
MVHDPIEEDSMTAAFRLAAPDLIDRHDLTVDDVAHLPEDLRYELIDGRLVLTPHAPTSHQLIALRIANAIEEHCPDESFVNVEQAILVNDHNELRPDVVLVEQDGGDHSPLYPSDVILVVEIISKSSRFYDRREKLERYAECGIPAYWIVDAIAQRVTFTQYKLRPDGTYQVQLETDELVTVDEPWKIVLNLPAWTRRRDRIRELGRRR